MISGGIYCNLMLPFDTGANTTRMGSMSSNQMYMLDNVNCMGNETSLLDCEHKDPIYNNCHDNERAGVKCISMYSLR